MKKYKLIKTYPGSVPLGSIATESKKEGGFYTHTFINNDNEIVYFSLFHSIVEDHSEYWEKLKEFTTEDGKTLDFNTIVFLVAKYSNSGWRYLYPLLIRTQDQVDFLDRKNPDYKVFSTEQLAKDFIETNKPKIPLFTTEDEIKVFEGDKVYRVYKDICSNNWTVNNILISIHKSHVKPDNIGTWFKDIEKAYKFVAEKNKKLLIENAKLNLSLNEIMTLFESNHSTLYVNLVQKAKEKLGITD